MPLVPSLSIPTYTSSGTRHSVLFPSFLLALLFPAFLPAIPSARLATLLLLSFPHSSSLPLLLSSCAPSFDLSPLSFDACHLDGLHRTLDAELPGRTTEDASHECTVACVRMCVQVCTRVRMCVQVCTCVHMCVCVHAFTQVLGALCMLSAQMQSLMHM